MEYPYFLQNSSFVQSPIFGAQIRGTPLVVSMDDEDGLFKNFNAEDQSFLQNHLTILTKQSDTNASLSGYLESRRIMLLQKNCLEMIKSERYYHLGLDISVEADTTIFTPLPATVVMNVYEEGNGQYGGMVVLKHELKDHTVFYSVYGHLHYEETLKLGTKLTGGQAFARIGTYEENGQWFTHLHLQVLTERGYKEGWVHKGYCTKNDLVSIRKLCPDPSFLLCY